jgi:hypothetical protein
VVTEGDGGSAEVEFEPGGHASSSQTAESFEFYRQQQQQHHDGYYHQQQPQPPFFLSPSRMPTHESTYDSYMLAGQGFESDTSLGGQFGSQDYLSATGNTQYISGGDYYDYYSAASIGGNTPNAAAAATVGKVSWFGNSDGSTWQQQQQWQSMQSMDGLWRQPFTMQQQQQQQQQHHYELLHQQRQQERQKKLLQQQQFLHLQQQQQQQPQRQQQQYTYPVSIETAGGGTYTDGDPDGQSMRSGGTTLVTRNDSPGRKQPWPQPQPHQAMPQGAAITAAAAMSTRVGTYSANTALANASANPNANPSTQVHHYWEERQASQRSRPKSALSSLTNRQKTKGASISKAIRAPRRILSAHGAEVDVTVAVQAHGHHNNYYNNSNNVDDNDYNNTHNGGSSRASSSRNKNNHHQHLYNKTRTEGSAEGRPGSAAPGRGLSSMQWRAQNSARAANCTRRRPGYFSKRDVWSEGEVCVCVYLSVCNPFSVIIEMVSWILRIIFFRRWGEMMKRLLKHRAYDL